MVEKLRLPFPLLSDPDRSRCIELFGAADHRDRRGIAHPALVLFDPQGNEVWRYVSRDFADRLPEDEVLEKVRELDLAPTEQEPPAPGKPEPGSGAMGVEEMIPYYRGARFAALAMGLRHGHLDQSIKDDSKAYVAEMDRFVEAVKSHLRG